MLNRWCFITNFPPIDFIMVGILLYADVFHPFLYMVVIHLCIHLCESIYLGHLLVPVPCLRTGHGYRCSSQSEQTKPDGVVKFVSLFVLGGFQSQWRAEGCKSVAMYSHC